jgi:hypothetical protein
VTGHALSTLPRPRTPGTEMAALARFYVDVSWSGTIEPDGMGPGSPAMSARGSGVHHRIHDGLWIVGDYRQDQFLPDGTFVLTWQLHWVTGWTPTPVSTGPRSTTTTGTPTPCAATSTVTGSCTSRSATARCGFG